MRRLALGALCLLAVNGPAEAQVAPSTPITRWEIEGYGGLSRFTFSSRATIDLPAAGAPITTSSPIFPSRQVPSWFFGDGAALLNAVNSEFSVPARITPLDSALGSLGLSADGGAFGLRLRRAMSPHVSAEIGVDVLPGSTGLPAELSAAAEASRATFETAMGALLASGPFNNIIVTATTTTTRGSSREIAATGALNVRFGTRASLEPYVTLGAGLISRVGDLPSIALEGNYRASILGIVPINETDRVTLRYEQARAFVGVFGGGLRRTVSDRWGIAIDARALVGRHTTRLLVDTASSVASGTPAGFIESFTHPSIQFSNSSSTGRQSSLSAPGLAGYAAAKSTATQTRSIVTIGVFVKF